MLYRQAVSWIAFLILTGCSTIPGEESYTFFEDQTFIEDSLSSIPWPEISCQSLASLQTAGEGTAGSIPFAFGGAVQGVRYGGASVEAVVVGAAFGTVLGLGESFVVAASHHSGHVSKCLRRWWPDTDQTGQGMTVFTDA